MCATLVALAAAGCGSSASTTHGSGSAVSSSSQGAGSPSRVTSVDGSFATVIPSGFQDSIGTQGRGPFNMLYLATRPYMAVNALRSRAPATTSLDAIAQRGITSLQSSNPSNHDFSRVATVSVDGASARAWSYLGVSERGQPAVYAEVNVLHGGWLYAIGGTAPANQFPALQAALGQVIAHWRWSGGA
jgi:hypothetical protein